MPTSNILRTFLQAIKIFRIGRKKYVFEVGPYNNEVRPNGKGKAVVLTVKEYVEIGGVAPFILNPGIRWRLVVNFTHRPLSTPR